MMAHPAFGMPGGFEWIVVAIVVLLLFGAKRLPEIARSMGKASKEFKKARREFTDEANEIVDDTTADPQPKPKTETPAEPEAADKKNA